MPVTGMTAPENITTVESVAPEKPEPRSVESRTDGDAEAKGRTGGDRPRRWRRITVTRGRRAVRLNRIRAGVRAWSSSKRECEHRQYYQYMFFFHRRYPLCCLAH